MKLFDRLLLPVALALVVAACMTSHDVITDRPWKLAEIGGAAPVDPDGIVGVSFGTDGRFTISTGCSSGGGTWHVEGNRIVLDTEALQPSPCDEAMGAQDAILRGVVEGGPRFEIETRTGRLRLTGESGEILLFETP